MRVGRNWKDVRSTGRGLNVRWVSNTARRVVSAICFHSFLYAERRSRNPSPCPLRDAEARWLRGTRASSSEKVTRVRHYMTKFMYRTVGNVRVKYAIVRESRSYPLGSLLHSDVSGRRAGGACMMGCAYSLTTLP